MREIKKLKTKGDNKVILFELTPFAKEIVEKTNKEFAGEIINRATLAKIDHRIEFINRMLDEYGVDEQEKQLFMKAYKRALHEASKQNFI